MDKNIKNNKEVFSLIDMIFKAREEGRVDQEEALLMIKTLFDTEIDEETLSYVRFICLFRPRKLLDVSIKSHYYHV